ncbi:MAG: hypothetical protein V4451_17360 [Pseudomonadota bacterium]
MATTKKDSPPPAAAVRILKIGKAPSLSGKSTLTYHVGTAGGADVRFRIYDNDGGGFYGREWISAADIQKTLSKLPMVTSASLHSLFRGKSANSGGFLLAVLKHEGLFKRSAENPRCYVATESPAFVAEVQKLIEKGTSLDPGAPPSMKPGGVAKKPLGKVAPAAVPTPAKQAKAAVPAASKSVPAKTAALKKAPWDQPAKPPVKASLKTPAKAAAKPVKKKA